MRIRIFTLPLLSLLFVILISTPVHADKYARTEDKLNITPKDLGTIALVIRGGDHAYVTYHRSKAAGWASAVGAGLTGGIGWTIGAIVTESAPDTTPVESSDPNSEMKKSLRKDLAMQQQLDLALGGWSHQEAMASEFVKAMGEPYHFSQTIKNPTGNEFSKVTPDFYQKGKRGYGPSEATFDYTSLNGTGIDTVMEVFVYPMITSYSILSKKAVPYLETRINVIDLKTKTLLLSKFAARGGYGKMDKELDLFLANNAEETKRNFQELTPLVMQGLSKKIQGKMKDDK